MSEIGQEIIAEVRKIVAKKPKFIYRKPRVPDNYGKPVSTCFYVYGSAPSCILGHALWMLDLIDETLEKSTVNQSAFARGWINRFIPELDDLDQSEWDWLAWVQEGQDEALPWATAVKNADDTMAQLLTSLGSGDKDG